MQSSMLFLDLSLPPSWTISSFLFLVDVFWSPELEMELIGFVEPAGLPATGGVVSLVWGGGLSFGGDQQGHGPD